MATFRILSILILSVAISSIEGRVHKRRFLQNSEDDQTLVKAARDGRFLSFSPPQPSGGSPVCIIARNKKSLFIEDTSSDKQGRQTITTGTGTTGTGTTPTTTTGTTPPTPTSPPPPPPPPPPTPVTPPPITPPPVTPPPPPPNINCIIVDKNKPSGKWRSADDGDVKTSLKSGLVLHNRQRQIMSARKQLKHISSS